MQFDTPKYSDGGHDGRSWDTLVEGGDWLPELDGQSVVILEETKEEA